MKAIKLVWQTVRTVVPIALSIAVLIVVIAWLSGAFEDKIAPEERGADRQKYTGQETDEVHEVVKETIEEAQGTLKAASRTAISSKVLARITTISASAGDQVSEGDVLVQLDSADLESRLRQAEQAYIGATATRKEAETSYERYRQLVSQNAVSQAAFDEADRRLQVSRAEEQRAEEAVNEARVMVSYTTIAAPKNGRVVDRLAEPGDMARPGEPLLVLYDATSLRLEAAVSEQLAVKLHVGERLNVYLDALNREVEGTIGEIVPQADALSRSLLVKVKIPNSGDLVEGMFGRLRIPAGQRRHLCLAEDAIHTVGQLELVEVVTGDNQIEKRFITTGRIGMPGRIEVLSGLKAGERVVLRSQEGSAGTAGGGVEP